MELSSLVRKIDEKFVQQLDRIAFHQNDEENDYKVQERRLSSLMLDKSISDEKHFEYARTIIVLSDSYRQAFLCSLQQLNDEIGQELVEFQELLKASSKQTSYNRKIAADMDRWLCLSKELQEARVIATNFIIKQTEIDKFIPTIIVRNNGRADIPLSVGESTEFQTWAETSVLMKESYENNQRIQLEREPLTERLLPIGGETEAPTQTSVKPQRIDKSIHPLESKVWFRSLKVAYVALWIAGLGVSAIIAYGADGISTFLIGVFIVSIVLIIGKMIFYYITLGRTTANEKPGKGFVDLEELRNDFATVHVNSADVYGEVVAPFLDSWKVQYGRRVPIQAVNHLIERVEHEMSTIKVQKQRIIDKAAHEGSTIEISKLRENFQQEKAKFKGPHRQQCVRQLDRFLMSLEAKYGTAIPVDEASKLLDKLDDDIRAAEKRVRSGIDLQVIP
jgi:hypothetical protein